MDASITFNKSSIRVKKAKVGNIFLGKLTQNILKVLILVNLVFGAGVVLFLGLEYLFAFIPLGILFPFEAWLVGDVKNNSASYATSNETIVIHDVLESGLLAHMKNPYDIDSIIKATKSSWQYNFYGGRFFIDESILKFIPNNEESVKKIWNLSYKLAVKHNLHDIDAGTVIVAMAAVVPNIANHLAIFHLDWDDVENGLQWHRHIRHVIKRLEEKEHFGGIAEDWAAGYTPLLNRLGVNLTSQIMASGGVTSRQADFHKEVEDEILDIYSKGGRQIIALVGDVGVGKSSLVKTLSYRIMTDSSTPQSVKFHKIYSVDAPSLLAHVPRREQLEAYVQTVIGEIRHARNIILFLDDAINVLKDGTGSADLSSVLLPIFETGVDRIILALTPQEWSEISSRNPAFAALLQRITVQEPEEATTMRIIEDQLIGMEFRLGTLYSYPAIKEAYRLAERYIQDVKFPKRALQVLEGASSFADGGLVTEASVQKSLESYSGVKVQIANALEKEQLLSLEEQIHQRMVNQVRAVKVVSDALRRSRSGVGNPNKPVGTFLFLGPTGVGKTELAKAIGDAYFGGEGKMIRVDMNQYVNKEDLSRLLTPAGESENGLVAQITRQPFSVVLFDEIEKAHQDVKNSFLQLLDEGIMHDAQNRNISFRDAIIVATSNAGADRIREHIEAGKPIEDLENTLPDELIKSGQFAPELMNRFDEVVVFRPLKQEELMQVVDILIAGVNKTLARQKVSVLLTDNAKNWLVQKGYDPKMGARPLRRVVQRTVENVVANKLLSNQSQTGQQLVLDVADLESAQ